MQYQVDKNRTITLLDNQFQVDNIKTGTQRLIAYKEIKAINLCYANKSSSNRGIGINFANVGCYTCTISLYSQEKITIQNLPIDYWTGVKRNAAYIKLVKLLHEKTAHLPVNFYTGSQKFKEQFFVGLLSYMFLCIFLCYINIVLGFIAIIGMLFTILQRYLYEYAFNYLPTDIPTRFLPLP